MFDLVIFGAGQPSEMRPSHDFRAMLWLHGNSIGLFGVPCNLPQGARVFLVVLSRMGEMQRDLYGFRHRHGSDH
jgi:hypothetical protein